MWASMILNGMQTSDHVSQHLERKWPSRYEGTDFAMTANEGGTRISAEVAAVLLEAVYQHLQPRYPFLDWIVMHDQWQRRDAILQATATATNPDREEATAAFFILMVMAIGTQLCSRLRLPGLARPETYFQKALVHIGTIVQLHNLANVQGTILYTCYQ